MNRTNKQEVLAAVRQYGSALCFASDALRGDREVVLAAVAQEGWALWYASDELQDDREIVLAAVRQDGVYTGHFRPLAKRRNWSKDH